MRDGFTLIELLIVLAIVSILVAIAIVGLEGAQMSARNVTREGAISAISKDISSYFNSNHYYPSDILFNDNSTGYSSSGNSYNSCLSQNGNFSNHTRICLGIAIAPSVGSGGRTWSVEKTILNGILSNNSGFDGYSYPNNKTTSSQTQFFYFDSVLNGTHYPLGYLLGFCKEGGGISYITGGTKAPKIFSQTNTTLTVMSPYGYYLWGLVPYGGTQSSVTCN